MTHRRISFISRALLGCAVSAVVSTLAQADVTMEEHMAVQGAGLMKMANMNGTTVTTISGDKARTESNLTFESGMVRVLARGAGQNTEIVRLDQDKIYSLNPKKKTYTETTFAERRAAMQEAMQNAQKAQASQQQSASGVDEAKCEWSDPKAEVKRSGEKATLAGYDAERVIVTATQSCKDKESGQVCDFGLTVDSWYAPNFQASEETLAYQRAYAQKLGLNAASSRDFAERAESMFGRYKAMWTEVATKMRDVKGYPVKSSFSLGVGGAQCQSTQESAAATGLGGALGSALGGVFGHKKQSAPEPTTPVAPPPTGLTPLMTVSTELVSVNRGAVSPPSFEVPSDYKKAKD
jgi:hypothetical protein